jgi:hypothetical protein
MRFSALGRKVLFVLIALSFSLSAKAQISLVRWDNFFFGSPPLSPTTYLAMNNGKPLSNAGQGSAGFISGGQYIVNNWSVGNYFQANFSTVNYSSNTVTFLFGAFEFGAKNFKLQYATNSAGPFTDFGAAISFPAAGGSGTYTYNLPAACNSQANVYVRITATSAGGAGGNYLENFEVKGTAMTAPSITTQPTSSTVCEGSDAVYSLVANNAITYKWQFRTSAAGTFADCPNNATYDNETTASLTVNNVTAAMSGYQFRCIVTGGTTPDATSNTVTMTVNAYGTWNGSVNANWDNPSNWNCNQVPTASTNVTINSGGTQPVINVNNATCANLTINSGATLSFSGSTNVLDVKGTVSGAGTLNGTAGKVIFSGTGAQTVPGGSYKDLQMNGTGAKTLGGNATVAGILTLTSGTLALGNNNLTITNTGSVAAGASTNSFVVTNGTGTLTNQNIGSGGKTGNINFPIGATTSSYTPMVINNTTGTADNFSAQVKDNVYTNYTGTTGSGQLSTNAVNKTWFMNEGTAGGSNATIQLTWNGSNELPGFDRDNCKLSHYTGGAWQAGPFTFAVGADPYTVSRTGITSFSPFGVGSTASPLPLDLIAFTGKKVKADVQLNWTTANEKAVKDFSIERSADGDKYGTIGTVAARNQGVPTAYSFTDKKAPAAALFYRLKMTDLDGAHSYSTIVRIARTGDELVMLFPNPVQEGVLNILLTDNVSSDVLLSITDMAGKTVYSSKMSAVQANGHTIQVPVKALPAGNYLFQVSTNGAVISKSRFVKQ